MSAPSLIWAWHDNVSHIMSIVCFKLSSIEIFSALRLCSRIFLPQAMRNRISDLRKFLAHIGYSKFKINLMLCPIKMLWNMRKPWLPVPDQFYEKTHIQNFLLALPLEVSKAVSSHFSMRLTTLQPQPSSSRRAQPTSGLRGKSLAPGIISNRSWQKRSARAGDFVV